MLIIQNILLKWFDEGKNQQEAQQMEGWYAERGCRGSGLGREALASQTNRI